MKAFQSLAIGSLMALSLAACSSTPMDNSTDGSTMSGSSATSGTTSAGMEGATPYTTNSQGAGNSNPTGTTGDGNASGKSPGLSNNAASPTDVR